MTDHLEPTPRPWIAVPRPDGLVNIYHGGGVTDVALCVRPRDVPLIVAAPDLAASLQRMVTMFETVSKGIPWGKTFGIDFREMNEAECEARGLLAQLRAP